MAAMRVAPVQKTTAETIGKTARGKQQSGNQRMFYRLELLLSAISYAILILTSLLTTCSKEYKAAILPRKTDDNSPLFFFSLKQFDSLKYIELDMFKFYLSFIYKN